MPAGQAHARDSGAARARCPVSESASWLVCCLCLGSGLSDPFGPER
jgi:hypothetical protein